MNGKASRLAVRMTALAAAPVLFVAGCSSDPEPENDDAPASESPTPEPVKFAEVPEPCSLVSGDTIGEVVPEADPEEGEELESSNTTTSAACLWNGLDEYQFRSLTVSLRRFDSDPAVGSGDERATAYLQQMVDEITGDEANQEPAAEELPETGDEAVSVAYRVTKEAEDAEHDYTQQRVVVRDGNVVLTVDYSGAGFEDDDAPGAGDVKEAADRAAQEAAAKLGSAAGGGEGEEEGGEDSEDSGESGDAAEGVEPERD
ncbi:hypothetical protein SAMN06297387_12620 [Streptomyces zhaozhouensis]|uniref:DUF3558 domain-containing protein n=1 Tax=Streptomyces zhaozhouensis TaxID=1300267 RepID=A0A286E6G8_9ACTN|nr:DUF3558 domain-containing protein [Streptomyces zhaozhouensis]SOD66502.1 hypothetical protein SAMN06297387_12620 [Streptomyces zhaozhouensis]